MTRNLRRIAVIDGHPDADPARFGHALAGRYCDAALGAGYEVRRIEVARLDFPIVRSRGDWEGPVSAPAIREAQETIAWAEHLLVLYPLWLGDMPALLKAFFEQVLRPDFAFDPNPKGRWPAKKLKGRTARVVVTMGMPALIYRTYYGAHSIKSLERNILRFVGIRPLGRLLIGMVENDEDARRHWLDELGELGAAGI